MKMLLAWRLRLPVGAGRFSTLNPNDVGTWPVIPRVVILVGLFVLLVTAGWWFVWQDQLDSRKANANDEVKLEGGVSWQEAAERQSRPLSAATGTKSIVPSSHCSSGCRTSRKSRRCWSRSTRPVWGGFAIRAVQTRSGTDQAIFARELPTSVRLVGTYHDFGAFAGDIGRLSRIVTLEQSRGIVGAAERRHRSG